MVADAQHADPSDKGKGPAVVIVPSSDDEEEDPAVGEETAEQMTVEQVGEAGVPDPVGAPLPELGSVVLEVALATTPEWLKPSAIPAPPNPGRTRRSWLSLSLATTEEADPASRAGDAADQIAAIVRGDQTDAAEPIGVALQAEAGAIVLANDRNVGLVADQREAAEEEREEGLGKAIVALGINQYQGYTGGYSEASPEGIRHLGRSPTTPVGERYPGIKTTTVAGRVADLNEEGWTTVLARNANARLWQREAVSARKDGELEDNLPGGPWSGVVRELWEETQRKGPSKTQIEEVLLREHRPWNSPPESPTSACASSRIKHLTVELSRSMLHQVGTDLSAALIRWLREEEVRELHGKLELERQKKLEVISRLQTMQKEKEKWWEDVSKLRDVRTQLGVEKARSRDLEERNQVMQTAADQWKKEMATAKEEFANITRQAEDAIVQLRTEQKEKLQLREAIRLTLENSERQQATEWAATEKASRVTLDELTKVRVEVAQLHAKVPYTEIQMEGANAMAEKAKTSQDEALNDLQRQEEGRAKDHTRWEEEKLGLETKVAELQGTLREAEEQLQEEAGRVDDMEANNDRLIDQVDRQLGLIKELADF